MDSPAHTRAADGSWPTERIRGERGSCSIRSTVHCYSRARSYDRNAGGGGHGRVDCLRRFCEFAPLMARFAPSAKPARPTVTRSAPQSGIVAIEGFMGTGGPRQSDVRVRQSGHLPSPKPRPCHSQPTARTRSSLRAADSTTSRPRSRTGSDVHEPSIWRAAT